LFKPKSGGIPRAKMNKIANHVFRDAANDFSKHVFTSKFNKFYTHTRKKIAALTAPIFMKIGK